MVASQTAATEQGRQDLVSPGHRPAAILLRHPSQPGHRTATRPGLTGRPPGSALARYRVSGNTPGIKFAPSHHKRTGVGIIGRVSTTSVAEPTQIQAPNRPNLVSVGTIVWLSSELMFFAALFAMYFTVRQVTLPDAWPPEDVHLNIVFASLNTAVLVSSSLTCQLGVFAAERGDVVGLRKWFAITYLMGAIFVGGQVFEYTELIHEGLTLSSDPYGSVFFLTTGFHAAHVTGGLIAFLFVLATTYIARRFDHDQATRAIVVSYYWHFVDVVWIALFATIYFIQ